ncbi:MAG TPA: dTDP-4-dehydrorhamnose 3,5-epimerase [Polyangia bacterium]|nr:dTDP-4-dehydrorhamnose 3,5-epimerase [Polyangia bacterium]
MNIIETSLPGVLIIEPKVFGDDRGFFLETYQQARYASAGITEPFVQDNLSRSARGTLRGLHFQQPNPQGKLVQALRGAVFDVAVDLRRGSPTFGRWFGAELSEQNRRQMWIPGGFAHGFCVVSESADFAYKCTANYAPESGRAIAWDDPDLGIEWPITDPLLSAQDRSAPRLRDAPVLP